jgi:hypothetical protein
MAKSSSFPWKMPSASARKKKVKRPFELISP